MIHLSLREMNCDLEVSVGVDYTICYWYNTADFISLVIPDGINATFQNPILLHRGTKDWLYILNIEYVLEKMHPNQKKNTHTSVQEYEIKH